MPRLHKGRIDTIINSFVTILGAIMTDIAISVKHLTKVYKLYQKPSDRLKEALNPFKKSYHEDFYALNDVSFEIKKGETVGIIGKNGAGKSTLLKIITGVLTPTSGSVHVNGKIASLLELGAGFNPDYTGLENVYFQGSLMGYTREEMASKIDEILVFADIGEFIHQPVKTYSSGMFARLAFSVAINVDPDILIVDEALSVGDIKFQMRCYKKFEDMKQKNITILFVSHDITAVRNICSKCLWVDAGLIKKFGDVLKISSKYLGEMYNQQTGDEIKAAHQPVFSNFELINRWGSAEGCIEYVEMFNQHNNITNHFALYDSVRIHCRINLTNPIINKSTLNIAISIKNPEGNDILVSSTMDKQFIVNETTRSIEVTFEFTNYLKKNEYILVVAVENRQNNMINYYDYVEGAKYFHSDGSTQLHGMFHQPFNHKIHLLE